MRVAFARLALAPRAERSRSDAASSARSRSLARAPGRSERFAAAAAWARASAWAPRSASTRATGGSESNWEDLFDAFERQGAAARARDAIPRGKTAALERALARGRRRVEVGRLCKELELDRSDVLAWLKANGHRAEELAVKYADALREEDEETAARAEAREREREDRARKEREREDRPRPVGPGGMPAYKTYKKTRLGASNIATLEKVYEVTQYPDDAMLESIRQATKLPTSKIITWFKERRTAAKRGTTPGAERRGTTGGYSYPRRDDADDRRSGLRRGDARDEYGGGPRRGRDSASDWSARE